MINKLLLIISRLWTDEIIDPLETRKVISMGIEAKLIMLLFPKTIILV